MITNLSNYSIREPRFLATQFVFYSKGVIREKGISNLPIVIGEIRLEKYVVNES